MAGWNVYLFRRVEVSSISSMEENVDMNKLNIVHPSKTLTQLREGRKKEFDDPSVHEFTSTLNLQLQQELQTTNQTKRRVNQVYGWVGGGIV